MPTSKLMSLKEAISTFVDNGDLIGTGGLSFWRKPMSACREIVRQEKKNLTICTFVGGLDVDILIGGGCVSEVRASFVGMEVFGMAPNYRKAIESGQVKLREESEASIAGGLKCSYLKIPFFPLKGIIGTDFPKVRNDLKQFEDPLGSGTQLIAMPKIDLDVAIVHVNHCDEYGNANIGGAVWMDDDMAKTAKKTIIMCEKLVETEDIIHLPRGAQIPMQSIEAVVRMPFGAHPTSCFPIYTFDPIHIQIYMKSDFNKYKQKFILNKTHAQYLESVGGAETILNIIL
ncbi:MAG: CoA transferase subunit A [Promethearchaeota archaeon]